MAYLTDPDRDSSMSEVRTPNVKLLLFLLCLQLLSIAALTGGPPRINSNYPKELWVPAGEVVRLSCPVASDSEETRPMITWQKDQDAIGVGWERFKTKSELLLIKDAEILDSGIYVCTATNGFGTVSAEHKVCVFGNETELKETNKDSICKLNDNKEIPDDDNDDEELMKGNQADVPSFQPGVLKNMTVYVGETVSFLCQVYSRTDVHIQWLKQVYKDELKLNRTISLRENEHFSVMPGGPTHSRSDGWYLSKLTLKSVTLNEAGVYVCSASNMDGFGFRTAFLKVRQDSIYSDDGTRDTDSKLFVPLITVAVVVFAIMCIGVVICLVHRRCLSRQSSPAAPSLHQQFPNTFPQSDVKSPNGLGVYPDIHCKQNSSRNARDPARLLPPPPNGVLPPTSQPLLMRQQEQLQFRYLDDC